MGVHRGFCEIVSSIKFFTFSKIFLARGIISSDSRLAMSNTTKSKTPKKKNDDAITIEDAFEKIANRILDLQDSLASCGQATRELAESVEAWKVTTIVFTLVSTIALIISLVK